ncbi:hypothetical protein K505DRAFT_130385 [Melanomma pulvis-pyrius CBS 109.77]|uniref:Uncharacterized protein n=1 Tax=Melanomma pulvis-pyrius CBS 109.77 TaxID=1314802 RepID=A0A6A6WU23_9PLEO|nr:hypothetical protein K505DRAFT_130385 [Melanomma pulvis-pyrius CBS 109.77]
MRLLKCLLGGDFQLVSFNDDVPPYAILSHPWTEGQEVTYNELVTGTGKEKTGYAKIRFAANELPRMASSTAGSIPAALHRLTTDDNALRKGWHMPPKMAAERT